MNRTSLRTLIGVFLFFLCAIAHAQSTPPNTPIVPIYGPPYHIYDAYFYVPPADSIDGVIANWWTRYQSYWYWAFPGCTYTTQYIQNGTTTGLFAGVTLHNTCGGGDGVYGTKQCPPGYKLSGNTCVGDKQVAITPSAPFIPVASSVINGHVLTESSLDLQATQGSDPLTGISVPLQSDRGTDDQIDNPGVTNSAGVALAFVSTRNQPGTSTITSATADIVTSRSGVINWLPAKYEASFEITCYDIALESNFLHDRLVAAPGIPNRKYHSGFVKDTKMQGTGQALDGRYIHYRGHGEYEPVSCPVTRSGACAVDGVTAAVDPDVIPLLSNISIDGVGDRTAQDTGGKIKNEHIDLFYGTKRHACLHVWGKRYGIGVTLLNYGN